MKQKILVVDDEETLREGLKFNLEAEGYEVDTVGSAEDALALQLGGYDLILLDIMMGDISGVQLARILKANPATSSVPVVFCTARDSEDDVVSGLELGADDYITKPYSLRTLLARVKSVLRRSGRQSAQKGDEAGDVSYEGLVMLPDSKRCMVDGVEVKLTRKEFEILFKLLKNKGRVFSREELLRDIWEDEVVVADRVVDVNISRIRQKTGAYAKYIKSRTGYGYGFMV